MPLLTALAVVAVILLVAGVEPRAVLIVSGCGLASGGAVGVARWSRIGKVSRR